MVLGKVNEKRKKEKLNILISHHLRLLMRTKQTHLFQWLKVIRDERERYEDIRHRLMITPGLGDETLDPLLNNPLSQHEQVREVNE